jgi:hypothetical protein
MVHNAGMAGSSWNLRRLLILGLSAILVWQGAEYYLSQRTRPDRLVNQLWVERMPASPRDMVWQFAAIEHEGHRLGAIGRISNWRLFLDRFIWKQNGDTFEVVTPQNNCRLQLKARTWKCAGQAPRPFELCLELESGGKKYRYFSREEWVIRPGGLLAPGARLGAPTVQTALLGPVNVPTGPATPAEMGAAAPAGACPAFGSGQ